MSEALAKRAIADIPVGQLQEIVSGLDNLTKSRSVELGGVCGCGCNGDQGGLCGLACANISRATVGVIDPANKSGITRAELDAARSKVIQFKETLLTQARIAGVQLR